MAEKKCVLAVEKVLSSGKKVKIDDLAEIPDTGQSVPDPSHYVSDAPKFL